MQSLQNKKIHRYFPCKNNLHIWNIILIYQGVHCCTKVLRTVRVVIRPESSGRWNIEECDTCNYCKQVDILSHYFAECITGCTLWKYLKTWFSYAFEFCINFTPLDILLGIPNHSNSTEIDILNFVILYAKFYIYSCKRNTIPIDLYSFQVKLNTQMVVEEYRCNIFNKQEEFKTNGPWIVLAFIRKPCLGLTRTSVIGNRLWHVVVNRWC